jgi:hypothetical protein
MHPYLMGDFPVDHYISEPAKTPQKPYLVR